MPSTLLTAAPSGFFVGHSFALQFRLMYQHNTGMQSLLTEAYFVMEVISQVGAASSDTCRHAFQAIVLAVLGYNLGLQLNSSTQADSGLVGGVVIVMLLYFLASQLIHYVFRCWQRTMFQARSVIQRLCSTWCSLDCSNDRASMLLLAFQHALLQIIVAGSFIDNTARSTFSKSFCTAAIVLTVLRIPIFVLWLLPVLIPDIDSLGRCVRRLGSPAFFFPRQQHFHVRLVVALAVVALAIGIGTALIIGSPSSTAHTTCSNLPQRSDPLAYRRSDSHCAAKCSRCWSSGRASASTSHRTACRPS